MKTTIIFTLFGLAAANHPSCKKILDTWWHKRKEHIAQIKVSEWDKTCAVFKGDRIACINPGAEREQYFQDGLITAEERDKTPCVMLGAKSKQCVSNPCNHFNTGRCTLQYTGGLCNWITKKDAKKFNLKHGCYRNPCHIGGMGKTKPKECEERGIPNYIECTYCKGKGKLKGKGMGCQRVDVTTKASCAPVNSNIPPKNSVWKHKIKKRCQCSDMVQLCKNEITNDLNYIKKYP